MKNLIKMVWLFVFILTVITSVFAQEEYPAWSYEMKIFPFDILYPFNTAFSEINDEGKTTDTEIIERLNGAKNNGANTVIFYIDNEQSYETFVDEVGFNQTFNRIQFLVSEAHKRNLKVVCYLNGLEVITVGATADKSLPSFARNYSDWLQIDITGNNIVWYTTEETEWIPANSEDAWASPLSSWRNFFKQRLISLSSTELDGVYIDATFLPGVESFGIKWASSDIYFQNDFQNGYGLSIPSNIDWNSEQWRKFIYFRHEIIRDYLGELADVARNNGMVPFFESSSCDLRSGTYLANDISFTISGGIACSPEIEPEGDYFSAFRMSKATRDANQYFPMWYLGWPETADQARREFAITICHSGNFYPTADSYPPTNAFTFVDIIRDSILKKRVPFQNTALVYPMCSKDYSFQTESTFYSYNSAFETLARMHIPFRILPLETMNKADLTNINNIVLAGVESISNTEYNLLKNKTIVLIGENGTKDEWGNNRSQKLNFENTIDISGLLPNLPFTIQAPSSSYIEYYTDKTKSNSYFIFVYNNIKSGNIIVSNSSSMSGKVYEIDNSSQDINGTVITVPIVDYLEIIELHFSTTTAVNELNDSLPSKIKLYNYPNPFNPTTIIKYSIPNLTHPLILSQKGKERSGKSVLLNITLKIYDVLGQEIITLVDGKQNHGTYKVQFNASELNSGVYFYKLQVGDFLQSKKMLLIK